MAKKIFFVKNLTFERTAEERSDGFCLQTSIKKENDLYQKISLKLKEKAKEKEEKREKAFQKYQEELCSVHPNNIHLWGILNDFERSWNGKDTWLISIVDTQGNQGYFGKLTNLDRRPVGKIFNAVTKKTVVTVKDYTSHRNTEKELFHISFPEGSGTVKTTQVNKQWALISSWSKSYLQFANWTRDKATVSNRHGFLNMTLVYRNSRAWFIDFPSSDFTNEALVWLLIIFLRKKRVEKPDYGE